MRFLALLLILCALESPAEAAREQLSTRITTVEEDQTVRLDSGVQARFGDVVFPDAVLAAPWFGSHLLQKEIEYREIGEDRYGRTMIIAPDAQEEMLRDGIAVLMPQVQVRKGWLKAEAEAQAAKRGVWGNAGLVLTPQNAGEHLQEFHMVEGVITRIHEGKSATYLNFGERWQTDFSAMITGRARRGFKKLLEEIGPGSSVRVRGTLYEENGPMIRLTRPEQVEVVKAVAPSSPLEGERQSTSP